MAVLYRLFCAAILPVLFLAWLPQYLSHYRHIPLVQASALSALPFLVAFLAVELRRLGDGLAGAAGWTRGGFHRKLFVGLGAADLRGRRR